LFDLFGNVKEWCLARTAGPDDRRGFGLLGPLPPVADRGGQLELNGKPTTLGCRCLLKRAGALRARF